MLNITGADTKGQSTKRAVCAGMAVATNDGCTRDREPLFGANNVYDALAWIHHVEQRHAKFLGIRAQCVDLDAAFFIVDTVSTAAGWHVVVWGRQGQVWATHFATGHPQAFESLGAGHFVDQVAVNVDQRRAVGVVLHQVGVPNFIVQCGWSTHCDTHHMLVAVNRWHSSEKILKSCTNSMALGVPRRFNS